MEAKTCDENEFDLQFIRLNERYVNKWSTYALKNSVFGFDNMAIADHPLMSKLSRGFAIRINSIIDSKFPIEAHENLNIFVQLRLSLFHKPSATFFGSTWTSHRIEIDNMLINNENKLLSIPINEIVYVTSRIVGTSSLCIVEIIYQSICKDTLRVTHYGRGIGGIALFQSMENKDEFDSKNTCQIFSASPRDLYIDSKFLASTRPTDISLDYSLFEHKSLLNISDYLPENDIIGMFDMIPGLEYKNVLLCGKTNESSICCIGAIESVEPNKGIYLLPSVASIRPCSTISIYHLKLFVDNLDNIEQAISSVSEDIKIKSRRIKIGIHNGKKLVHDWVSYEVSKVESNILSAAGPIGMNQFSVHPYIVFVFYLEYEITICENISKVIDSKYISGKCLKISIGCSIVSSTLLAEQSVINCPIFMNPSYQQVLHKSLSFNEFCVMLNIRNDFNIDRNFLSCNVEIHIPNTLIPDSDVASKSESHPVNLLQESKVTKMIDEDDSSELNIVPSAYSGIYYSDKNQTFLPSDNDSNLMAVSLGITLQNEAVNHTIETSKYKKTQEYSSYEKETDTEFNKENNFDACILSTDKVANTKTEIKSIIPRYNTSDIDIEISDTFNQFDVTISFSGIKFNQTISSLPSGVYFTYQFYNFVATRTEEVSVVDDGRDFFKLYKSRKSMDRDQLMTTFSINCESAYEKLKLCEYLLYSVLSIDVWDSKSLLHLGNSSFPLSIKRNGKSEISFKFESSIIDYSSPINQPDSINTLNVNVYGNILGSSIGLLEIAISIASINNKVSNAIIHHSSFHKDVNTKKGRPKLSVSAGAFSDISSEISAHMTSLNNTIIKSLNKATPKSRLLLTYDDLNVIFRHYAGSKKGTIRYTGSFIESLSGNKTSYRESPRESSAVSSTKISKSELSLVERKLISIGRYLASLKINILDLLRSYDSEFTGNITRTDLSEILSKYGLVATDDSISINTNTFSEFNNGLKILESYQEMQKTQLLNDIMSHSNVQEITIFPSFGSVEYFDVIFENLSNHEDNFLMSFDDSDISLITSHHELLLLQQSNNRLLRNSVSKSVESSHTFLSDGVTIHLSANKTARIPFKFFSLGILSDETQKLESLNRSITIKVISEAYNQVFMLIHVKVLPQRLCINRTIRFFEPEDSIVKKHIKINLATLNSLSEIQVAQQIYVACIEPDIHESCQLIVDVEQPATQSDSYHVFFRYKTKEYPLFGKFYVLIYCNKERTKLLETWEVIISSRLKLDVKSTFGNIEQIDLHLKHDNFPRRVQLHHQIFSNLNVKVFPSNQFDLIPGALNKSKFEILASKLGNITTLINLVDVDSRELLSSWILLMNAVPNNSSIKSYDLRIRKDCELSKKIAFKNPWKQDRKFYVFSSNSSILKSKIDFFEVKASSLTYLRLKFSIPKDFSVNNEIVFIFLCDSKGLCEEIFEFKIEVID